MKEWRVPKKYEKLTWSVLTYPEYNVVVPTWDIQKHELESQTCPCGAQTSFQENGLMVLHESFFDKSRIDASMMALKTLS